MSRTNNPNAPLSLDPQIDEDRVRRALGLKTNTPHQQRPEQARQRHRFVSDGAVPVVMLNRADGETTGLKDRLAAAEAALETERAAHAATRRALQEAQAAHQALQTRSGHSELARNEALAAEREARRSAEEALAALRAELAETSRAEMARAETQRREPFQAAEPKPERPARKPRAAAAPKEPKPVRWWTPSYRAKQR
jgi:hypothetical protein